MKNYLILFVFMFLLVSFDANTNPITIDCGKNLSYKIFENTNEIYIKSSASSYQWEKSSFRIIESSQGYGQKVKFIGDRSNNPTHKEADGYFESSKDFIKAFVIGGIWKSQIDKNYFDRLFMSFRTSSYVWLNYYNHNYDKGFWQKTVEEFRRHIWNTEFRCVWSQ